MNADEVLQPRQWDKYGDHQIGGDEVDARQRTLTQAVGSRHVDFTRQPLQTFHPDELVGTQRYLWKEKHDGIREAAGPLPPVHVVKVGNTHYLRDGHHRVDLAREQGKRIDAHVLDAGLAWNKVR